MEEHGAGVQKPAAPGPALTSSPSRVTNTAKAGLDDPLMVPYEEESLGLTRRPSGTLHVPGYKPTAGLFSSALSFCNSTIGAGILGLPYAFLRTGWAWGCILLVVNAALCVVTMGMLEYSMRLAQARTYSETLYKTSGKAVKVIGDVFLILNFWGVMVAYQQIVPGSLLDILADRGVLAQDNEHFFWPPFLVRPAGRMLILAGSRC